MDREARLRIGAGPISQGLGPVCGGSARRVGGVHSANDNIFERWVKFNGSSSLMGRSRSSIRSRLTCGPRWGYGARSANHKRWKAWAVLPRTLAESHCHGCHGCQGQPRRQPSITAGKPPSITRRADQWAFGLAWGIGRGGAD